MQESFRPSCQGYPYLKYAVTSFWYQFVRQADFSFEVEIAVIENFVPEEDTCEQTKEVVGNSFSGPFHLHHMARNLTQASFYHQINLMKGAFLVKNHLDTETLGLGPFMKRNSAVEDSNLEGNLVPYFLMVGQEVFSHHLDNWASPFLIIIIN